MMKRKLRPKAHIKNFLKDNINFIKGLGRKNYGKETYTRDSWMKEANPMDDRYEGFLYKESDSL